MTSRRVALIAFLLLWSMSTHGKPSASGDEPYYLIVSHSLLADRDLDLANNFANNDGRSVGADRLVAGPHAKVNRLGELWSTHDTGLSVLVLPAYALGSSLGRALPPSALARFRMDRGRFAYFTVSVFLVALTSIGCGFLFAAFCRFARPGLAGITALVVTLSPPVLPHSFLVFPETPAFFVTCFVLWLAVEVEFGRRYFWTGVAAVALGCLPWIHRKFSFFVIALAIAFWQSQRLWFAEQRRGRIPLLIALFIVPQLLFHAFTLRAWGNIGGPQIMDADVFRLSGIGTGAAGMLLDRSRGLLPYAPIYLLLPLIWWAAGRRFLIWLLPIAALFLPMAAFVTWDAGYSPAARFLVPLMPLAALPAAVALQTRWIKLVAAPLLALQLVIIGLSWNRPRILWPQDVGDNRALNSIPVIGASLNSVFPVINQGSWR
jgi:hypothetical protein